MNHGTLVTIVIVVFVVTTILVFAYTIFVQHEKDFRHRLSRLHTKSPTSSKLDPPDVKGWKSNLQHILTNSKLYPTNFHSCKYFQSLKNSNYDTLAIAPKTKNDKLVKAGDHHMDHIYVTYFQFLWSLIFVGTFARLLVFKGITQLRLRLLFVKHGLVEKKPVDLEAIVGKLLLEQSQAIHYLAKTNKDSELGNIAEFFFVGK